jgi:hypothetical protein
MATIDDGEVVAVFGQDPHTLQRRGQSVIAALFGSTECTRTSKPDRLSRTNALFGQNVSEFNLCTKPQIPRTEVRLSDPIISNRGFAAPSSIWSPAQTEFQRSPCLIIRASEGRSVEVPIEFRNYKGVKLTKCGSDGPVNLRRKRQTANLSTDTCN